MTLQPLLCLVARDGLKERVQLDSKSLVTQKGRGPWAPDDTREPPLQSWDSPHLDLSCKKKFKFLSELNVCSG